MSALTGAVETACPGGRNFRVFGDKLLQEFFTNFDDEIRESPNLVMMLFTEFGDEFVDLINNNTEFGD